jgi:hypothetical protein
LTAWLSRWERKCEVDVPKAERGVAPVPFWSRPRKVRGELGRNHAAQIVASVPAPAPPASIASYASSVAVNYSLNPTAEQNVTAACPAGSKAMGGGFSNPSSALVLSAGSSPTADGAGWVEDLVNLSSSTAGAGQVFVTCLK